MKLLKQARPYLVAHGLFAALLCIVSTAHAQTVWPPTTRALATAKYIVKTADPSLPNAQATGALATGALCNATGTGTLSICTSSSVPPANATYIVQTSTNAPGSAQVLASLSTGLVKNTTTTGVLSIATAGTDYIVGTGVSGGQTLYGGTAAGDTLFLRSDSTNNNSQAAIKNSTITQICTTVHHRQMAPIKNNSAYTR